MRQRQSLERCELALTVQEVIEANHLKIRAVLNMVAFSACRLPHSVGMMDEQTYIPLMGKNVRADHTGRFGIRISFYHGAFARRFASAST